MPVLVIKTTEEPAVPSRVVQCSKCGEDCWESLETGDKNDELVILLEGKLSYTCVDCFFRNIPG